MRDYKKIHAWALADDLTVETYGLSKSFPREERYGLTGLLAKVSAGLTSLAILSLARLLTAFTP